TTAGSEALVLARDCGIGYKHRTMWSRPPFTALLRPQLKQLFMLGAAVLHLVPALIIGMQWQDFRLSAASLPREQVLQVDLLSLATSKNSLSLFPAEGAALSQQGQSVSASVPAS